MIQVYTSKKSIITAILIFCTWNSFAQTKTRKVEYIHEKHRIDITYDTLAGNKAVFSTLNQRIHDFVTMNKKGYEAALSLSLPSKPDSLQDWNDHWFLYIWGKITLLRKNFISIHLYCIEKRGVDESGYAEYINFLIEDLALIPFDDLEQVFTDEQALKEKIWKTLIKRWEDWRDYELWQWEELRTKVKLRFIKTPLKAQVESFYFSDEGIYLIFLDRRVAAFQEGVDWVVFLDWKDYAAYISPSFRKLMRK